MVAATLVPVEVAAGFTFESVQLVPAGVPSIAQLSATAPVNPLSPFTTMVSLILLPTLVATVAKLRVTVKSFTDSVPVEAIVLPIAVALIVTVEFPAGVVPKIEVQVIFERLLRVTPGV